MIHLYENITYPTAGSLRVLLVESRCFYCTLHFIIFSLSIHDLVYNMLQILLVYVILSQVSVVQQLANS